MRTGLVDMNIKQLNTDFDFYFKILIMFIFKNTLLDKPNFVDVR